MITLIVVSDGYKHFDEPIREYLKRLQKVITLKTLKPISHTNVEYIKGKETLALLELLKRFSGTVILCDERGKSMNTLDFAQMIRASRDQSEDLLFILWGSYGVDITLIHDVHPRLLQISDFVLPHSLAFLVLLEQIYRAHEILKGSGYHHS